MSVIIRNDHRIIAAIIGAYYCHYLLQSIHWLCRSGFVTPARRKGDAHFVCETNYLGKQEWEEFLSPSCLLSDFAHFPLSLRLHTFCFYLREHSIRKTVCTFGSAQTAVPISQTKMCRLAWREGLRAFIFSSAEQQKAGLMLPCMGFSGPRPKVRSEVFRISTRYAFYFQLAERYTKTFTDVKTSI